MVGPFLAYTKETDKMEVEGITPINIVDNPVLMEKVYSWGWAKNPHYMTIKECGAVDDAKMSAVAGTASVNSGFAGVTDFSAFEYFNSVTAIPAWQFRGAAFTKIKFPSSLKTIANWGLNNDVIRGVLDLSNTQIKILPKLYNAASNYNNRYIRGVILPKTTTKLGDTSQGVFDTSTSARTSGLKWVFMPCEELVSPLRYSLLNVKGVRFYVPDELVEVYKTDNTISGNEKYYAWMDYASQIYPISQWQEDVDNGVIVAK
jgi:hypothetical protein